MIKTIAPGTSFDDEAIELGFGTGTNYLIFQNPGNPESAAAITIRVKVYF